MTRKRFKNIGKDIFQYGNWWCAANGEHCAEVISIALNQLVEENEMLKHKNRKLTYTNGEYMDLSLRQRHKLDEREDENTELKKENEQLKSKLKIYYNVASCGNCSYHNYDWFDDGDEFEICEKRNDMKYHICEDWEELE